MEARYLTDLEWRICHAVNIYVFRNGRDGEQPILVHIPPGKKKNMRTVMGVIQDRVKYPVGYAKFLYKMDGTRVKDPCELEMYNNYVVASNFDKYFKCAAYGRKRSPLLVLNRESKHVRVLKLQNQNYYEWLLKKKAVGEERPPYIYPAYYTNENLRPQDLPIGTMGNYNPGEVQAPGCCLPRMDGAGGKTYRLDDNQKYCVNTVTVDCSPDLRNMVDTRKKRRPNKHLDRGQKGVPEKPRGKVIQERTPSDMINANLLAATSGTSHEAVSVVTSDNDEQVHVIHKPHHRSVKQQKSHRKTKSHRVIKVEPSDEEQTNDSTGHSSEYSRKQKKTSKRSKKRDRDLLIPDTLPPPPPQFRDNLDDNLNSHRSMSLAQPNIDINNNQDILKYVDRAMRDRGDTSANMIAACAATQQQQQQQKQQSNNSFFYPSQKIAEVNPSGNIQPLELTFSTHQPPTTDLIVNGDPLLDELVTILPPAEFRESLCYPDRPQVTQSNQDNYVITISLRL